MTLHRRHLLPALLLLALPAWAQAPAATRGTIAARAALHGGACPRLLDGVFMTLRNTGTAPDRLVSAASPLPRMVEIHTTVRDGEVMRMRPVDAVEVPPGGSVTLAPGGLHIMLMGLSQPMPAGSTVPVTLTFEHAGAVPVQVPVTTAGAAGPHAQN